MVAALCLSASGVVAADEYVYRVRPGETLIGISRFMLQDPREWSRLQRLNGISDPHRVKPGTQLRIPVALLRSEPVTARVTAVTGDVRTADQPLAAGSIIDRGMQVVTGAQSFATIELVDGSRLVLQPDSRLQFEELSRYRNTPLLDTRLRLDAGRVESIVTRTEAPKPQYRIITPAATIGVRGTRFRVGADDASGASRTEVTDGAVGVQGGAAEAKPATVPAGYGVVADAGGKVSEPVALLPPPQLAGLPRLQERTIVRIAFLPLAGAQRYRIQVGGDAEMRQVLAETLADKPEAKFADLADGKYTLRVRGIDGRGLEGRDADFGFTLKARPEAPITVAPLTGTKLSGESVELAWVANPDASRYRIQLAADAEFVKTVADIDGVEGTVIMPAGKLGAGEYRWRARSIRADGDAGPWSDAQRFVLKPLPADPPLPKIGENNLAFAWSGEPGQTFLFQFARDPQFADLVAEQRLNQPATTIARPLGGEYFLRVRAIDADGFVGPFSRAQKVEIPNPPPPWWLPLLMLLPAAL